MSRVLKTYLINEDVDNVYSNYINNNFYHIKSFMIKNNCICTYYDLINILSILPHLYVYLYDLGFIEHGHDEALDNVFVNKQMFLTLGSNHPVFDVIRKLANNIEMDCDGYRVRYNEIKNLVGLENQCTKTKYNIRIPFCKYKYFVVSIFNVDFHCSLPSLDHVRYILNNLFEMTHIRGYLDKSDDHFSLKLGNSTNFFCSVMGLGYNDIINCKKQVIDSIIYDFVHICNYRLDVQIRAFEQFKTYIKGIISKDGIIKSYNHFVYGDEKKSYRDFFHRVCVKIETDVSNSFKDYAGYQMESIPDEEHNTYKLDISLEDGLHPDYCYLKYILLQYNSMHNLGCKSSIMKFLGKLEMYSLTNKLIYIRELLKSVGSEFNEFWKDHGYIFFIGCEILLGYRLDHFKKEEMEGQIANNFMAGNEKNELKQVAFFDKYFDLAMKFKNNVSVPVSIMDVIQSNVNKYRQRELYVNKHIFFDAPGAAHYKFTDSRNIKRNMSKSQYYSSRDTVDEFFNNTYELLHDNNSIVIKNETVKKRIVVNTSLDTYVPLCKIEYILHKYLKGIRQCFSLLNNNDKCLLFSRLSRYTVYNKYVGKRYVLMPLDYSSYDTTITFGLIYRTLESYGNLIPYSNEIKANLDFFRDILFKEKIEFKELGTEYRYKYGVLSGWKITNLVESLLNYVISFGVMIELRLDLVDIITMGDDLVLVIDKPNCDPRTLRLLLERVSNKYKELGFNVHNIKNLCGYDCIEFLRNYYNGIGVITYPIRSIIPVFYSQPTSEIDYNNYSNYKLTLDKFIFKNGLFSHHLTIYKWMDDSTNKNIKEFGFKYYLDPDSFSVRTEMRYEYKYKGDVSGFQIYKYYCSLLNNKYNKHIYYYVKNNIMSKRVSFETIHPGRLRISNYKDGRMKSLLKDFFTHINYYTDLPNYEYDLGDYHINAIFLILLNDKIDIRPDMLTVLAHADVGLTIRNNLMSVISGISLKYIPLMLNGVKVKLLNNYFNNLIVKTIKYDLYKFILYRKVRNRLDFISAKNFLGKYLIYILEWLYIQYSQVYIYKYGSEKLPVFVYVD